MLCLRGRCLIGGSLLLTMVAFYKEVSSQRESVQHGVTDNMNLVPVFCDMALETPPTLQLPLQYY